MKKYLIYVGTLLFVVILLVMTAFTNVKERELSTITVSRNTNLLSGNETNSKASLSYVSDKYLTKNEANNWLTNKKNSLGTGYKIIHEEIKEFENEIISTNKICIEENFTTKEAAETRKTELEGLDVSEVNLTIDEETTIEELYKTIQVDTTFKTEEAAKAFIESLKGKYNVSVSTNKIYGEWISQGKIKVATLEKLTLEERDKKVNEIVEQINKEETDVLKYEVFINYTEDTERVYIRDEVTNDSKNFDSLKEAEDFIKELKLQENEDIKIVISGPNPRLVFVRTDVQELSKTCNTKEEALNYIKQFKDNGYTVENEEQAIKEEKHEETVKEENNDIIIKDSHKLDKNSSFSVKGNYIFIKQASGNVAIWTEEALNSEQQVNIRDNWLAGNYDGAISKDFNFYFINGLGTHDLSYIGNQWGEYTIVKNGDKDYTFTCDAANISHMDYGTFEKGYDERVITTTKYQVSGRALKDIFKNVYDVSYEKTEKIYENHKTYGANIEKEKFTRSLEYNVKGSYDELEIIEHLSYNLKGTYLENVRGSLWQANLKATKITPKKGKILYTGDKEDYTNEIILIGSLGLLIVAIVLGKKAFE